MTSTIRREIFAATLNYFLQPIVPLLEEDAVSEIMINGPHEVFVERHGRVEKTTQTFSDDKHLMAAVRNIAQYVGRHIRTDEPRFDARLPQGHRVHVILPPLCRNGVSVTIRKHSREAITLTDLIRFGTLNQAASDFLHEAIRQPRNIVVSGGTGSGKTTLLNVLTALIPEGERLVVIEDSAELQVQQEHVISLEARSPDRKGRGAVTIRDLLHSALRMRPDRILIGECRSGEAFDLLQALNTGHAGSMSTVHANSPGEALKRLETLALLSGVNIPIRFLRAQVASAVHIVVQLQRLGGRRVVQSITENLGLDERGEYRTVELFGFEVGVGELGVGELVRR